MKHIRIHNDIYFSWTIDRGDGTPYDLTGKDLKLWMRTGLQEVSFSDFIIEDNTIKWTFHGKDQYKTGYYDVILCENYGKPGQVTIDEQNIVELVAHTASSDIESEDGYVTTQYVNVVSHLKTEIYSGIAQEIYENYVATVQVLVKNGANMLRAGMSADLQAVVMLGSTDITSRIAPSHFSWRRSSLSPETDVLWNQAHEGVGPEIHVERLDVSTACTFYCVIPRESIYNTLSFI